MLDYLKDQASRTTHDTTYQNKLARDNFYWSKDWRHKRSAILIRDNSECQVCKSQGKVTINTKLIIHHIKPLEFFPNSKLSDSNLITVCLDCHNVVHGLTSAVEDGFEEWWG